MKATIRHVLYIESVAGRTPAGNRLYKGDVKGCKFPEEFAFEDLGSAITAQSELQKYLDGSKKLKRKD